MMQACWNGSSTRLKTSCKAYCWCSLILVIKLL